jgi:UDP-glucose 4-epimerase
VADAATDPTTSAVLGQNGAMRALVTGGAGFIGSSVVDRLVELGATVRVLDDLSTGYVENVHPAADLLVGDIADEATVRAATNGVEVIFHQAAHRSVFRSVESPLSTDRVNVGGTLNVLVAARDAGVRRVVCASSSSVYGGAGTRPTPESTPTLPRSPYAVSKLAGEHYCRVFCELYGLETVSLRYFNVYGPRQRPDGPYAAVIPLFIEALRTGTPPTVHWDGLQSRDFTFIADVVDANLAAASAPGATCAGKAYNVAGGTEVTLLELLATIEQVMGRRIPPVFTDRRPGDVRHTCADLTRVRADLGWGPATGLAEGIARTVAWFAPARSEGSGSDA